MTLIDRRIAFALLLTAATLQLARPESSSPSRSTGPKNSTDSSHLKLEPRVDDEPKIKSELKLNLGTTFKLSQKKSGTESKPKPQLQASRVNPMVSPRYNPQNNRPKDSYLDALQHSHIMNLVRPLDTKPVKFARRDYSPGPVYIPKDSQSSSSSSSSSSNSKKLVHEYSPGPIYDTKDSETSSSNKIETQAKVSKLAYNEIVDIVPSNSWSPSANEYIFGQQQQLPSVSISDYSSFDPPTGYESYKPPPSISYERPQSSYGHPKPSYVAPLISYGPPQNSYSSSSSSYGPPPETSYGPPKYSYGPSQGLGTLQASYSTSYPLPDLFPLAFFPPIDLSWPISLKLNAYTLIKIVLKIVIFKMIVKFIATICLLLFIPKLIHKKDENQDEDESRGVDEKLSFPKEQIQLLTSIITDSIKEYDSLNKNSTRRDKSCTSVGCQVGRKLFAAEDTWDDYVRLFKTYVAEEQAAQEKESKKNKTRRR